MSNPCAEIETFRENREKWDRRFLGLAEHIATWSKDPSTKVGAVLVRGGVVISTGYNGFPRGIADHESLLENRETKYPRTAHAELNAILNAGQRLQGCTLYTTLQPCSSCVLAIIQSGIHDVVFYKGHPARWDASFSLGLELLVEAGVGVRAYERTSDEAASSPGAEEPGRCEC